MSFGPSRANLADGLLFGGPDPPFGEAFFQTVATGEGAQQSFWNATVCNANDLALGGSREKLGQALLQFSDADIHVSTLASGCGHVNVRAYKACASSAA